MDRAFRPLRAAARQPAAAAGAALSRPPVPRATIPRSATAAASCSPRCATLRGRLLDLGTKGSGQTPYSRFGDGRLTLKGGVREILATEMLEALGVNTSKTFSLIETGEELHRGDEPSPTRSAVLVRLSHGHIRIGTFQRLAYSARSRQASRAGRLLPAQLYGEQPGDDAERAPARADVVARTAKLAASYMAAGFVHGVLNSDNINVTGESFDYGPWRLHAELGRPASPPPISTRTASTPSAASPRRSIGTWCSSPASHAPARRGATADRRARRLSGPLPSGELARRCSGGSASRAGDPQATAPLIGAIETALRRHARSPIDRFFFDRLRRRDCPKLRRALSPSCRAPRRHYAPRKRATIPIGRIPSPARC